MCSDSASLNLEISHDIKGLLAYLSEERGLEGNLTKS